VEDKAINPEASKLGGNLQASQDLYKDLQMTYQSTTHTATNLLQ